MAGCGAFGSLIIEYQGRDTLAASAARAERSGLRPTINPVRLDNRSSYAPGWLIGASVRRVFYALTVTPRAVMPESELGPFVCLSPFGAMGR